MVVLQGDTLPEYPLLALTLALALVLALAPAALKEQLASLDTLK